MPAAVPGTTVIRRQLGRRLRKLREQAGKTIADVAAAKLASEVKVWRIESGKVAVRIADARALCWLYGVDADTTDALAALAGNSAGQDWWERNDADTIRLTGFDLYLGLEAIAARLSLYQPEFVPGLLQTEEYARAMQWGSLIEPTPEDVERTVRTRLTRQELLFGRETPPQIDAVLGEVALTRHIGTTEVLTRQRSHLLELADRQGVEIRVLPLTAGPHPGFHGEFTLLDFDDPDDPAVVYTETDAGATYIERPEGVSRQRLVVARLQELSVRIEEFAP